MTVSPLDRPDLDALWKEAAARCGFRVERGHAAYAATDGRGTIHVGAPETLDAEDSVAQLVLHELCHALCQGEASFTLPDWGLDNTSDRDAVAEEACLRLQAELSGRHGLRVEMTPTTEWREYYQRLSAQPLEPASPEEAAACERARSGGLCAERTGISLVLAETLAETANRLAVGAAHPGSAKQHPLGWALGPADQTCGTCGWCYRGGRGPAVERCRQSVVGEVGDGQRVRADYPACERWEAPPDCLTCGACCREAYHSVSVSVRDPVVWKQPGLIVRDGHRWSLLRAGERCAALEDAGPGQYHCRIYEDRPRTCREFEQGGRHCLTARRRVGLSR